MRHALISAMLVVALAIPAWAGDEAIPALAARKAGVLQLMHEKAKRALVTAAQEKAFADYFLVYRSTVLRHRSALTRLWASGRSDRLGPGLVSGSRAAR